MLDRVVGAVSVIPFVLGSMAAPAGAPSSVDLTFQDPAIVESSGLVVRDGLFLTTNDSGDGGRVFVVDRSGETVGSTSWSDEPRDVEALAPGEPGFVWVGDIGDNSHARDSIEVLRVPYGREFQEVEPASYTLVYPDGPRDAESLLAEPRTGRLFVISKDIFGGTLYAAPRELSETEPNRLKAVADSVGFATDASFFPDGEHYIVRDYLSATVFTFPGHEEVGSFRLPKQRQGEGIAVDENDGVHVSTEGQFTDVRSVEMPASILAPPTPTPTATSSSEPVARSGSGTISESDGPWLWLLLGGVLAGFVAVGGWLLLRRGSAS
jgi:hypothetical protein